MHDIDSTRLELSPSYETSEEAENETLGYEAEEEAETPLTEAEEEAYAAELLGVSDEAEMDQFLGRLFRGIGKKFGGAAVKFLAANGAPLAGALKGLAAKALPFLGGVLGTAIPIPGVGTAVGAAVGKAASDILQSETEHLEGEEQEFQMARRYVRLASHAARAAARRPLARNRVAAANMALRQAVHRFQRSRGRGWRHGSYRGYPGSGNYADYSNYSNYGSACPPCAPCPPCPLPPPAPAQGEPANIPSSDAPSPPPADGSSGPGNSPPPNPTGELSDEYGSGYAFETDGESQDQGEYYETSSDPSLTPPAQGVRTGRWVRRGRKIVLYGL